MVTCGWISDGVEATPMVTPMVDNAVEAPLRLARQGMPLVVEAPWSKAMSSGAPQVRPRVHAHVHVHVHVVPRTCSLLLLDLLVG